MYIRTKDGVYEVLSEYDTPENTTLISNPVAAFDVKVTPRTFNGSSIRIIYSNEVISQSENIEELCDMFVEKTKTIFHKHNGYVINWKTNMVYSLKALSESYYSVKGAIYTDKGLIYVAKMNENGELELI